jgi:hypothetical protein
MKEILQCNGVAFDVALLCEGCFILMYKVAPARIYWYCYDVRGSLGK